jgi:uncharacterized protein (DUF1778 family)
MAAVARFDFTLNVAEKQDVSLAATLAGTTMSSFVRVAAIEKARELIMRESRVSMTAEDFQAFTKALNQPFEPNAALTKALEVASRVKRA